jgi:hypothetical protein
MKKIFASLALVAFVMVAGSALAVPTLWFVEDANGMVRLDPAPAGFPTAPNGSENPIWSVSEAEHGEFFIYLPTGNIIPNGDPGYGVQLNEPGTGATSSGTISDLIGIVCNVWDSAYAPTATSSYYYVFFFSKGASNFPTPAPGHEPNVFMEETGGIQLVIDWPELKVYVQADTYDAANAPIPGSWLLLSSGLLGLAGWRRSRKS